jgi:hypothetical protein
MITYTKNIIAFEDMLYYDVGQVDPNFFGETRETVMKMLEETNKSIETERAYLKRMRPDCWVVLWIILGSFLIFPLFILCCVDFSQRNTIYKQETSIRNKMEAICDRYNKTLLPMGIFCSLATDDVVSSQFRIKYTRGKNFFFSFTKNSDQIIQGAGVNVMVPVLN